MTMSFTEADPGSIANGSHTVGTSQGVSAQEPRASQHHDPEGSTTCDGVLAELKGQAQFLLYLVDQIEDSLVQFQQAEEASHASFLARVLSMYGQHLELKHQSIGSRVAEACQEVYIATRGFDLEP